MGTQIVQRRTALDMNLTNVSEITEATTLTLDQTVVHATANTATDSYSITLPSVIEAAGLFFSISGTIANGKAITLVDQDDSYDWNGDYTIDTDVDGILLYSDGRTWWVPENRIA